MPRNYSEKFLIAVNKLDEESIGVKLAKACVAANLPAQYVANAMGVSRMTIHSWFRGKPIRDKNSKRAKMLIQFIDLALMENVLPATSMISAKQFTDQISEQFNPQQ